MKFFFFLLGPQTASCEDCVWKVSLIRLYTKIQRVLKTQITSGVLGNVISSYRDVKRSWWAPSYVRRSWAPRSRVQLPGPDPALLLVLRRDVMSAWMAGIKGFTVCMKWTEETPYSHSGSKNGCDSGPQLVHPHRRIKISLVGKINFPGATFPRPTTRPDVHKWSSFFFPSWASDCLTKKICVWKVILTRIYTKAHGCYKLPLLGCYGRKYSYDGN